MLPIRPYYANMSTYRSTFHIVHKITMGYLSVFITVKLCVRFCILIFDILTGQCSSSQFRCSVTGECISILALCDRINTCSDGSDESNSVCCITFNVPVVSVSLPIDNVMGLQDALMEVMR